jgi:hypothetical protein
VVSYIRPTINTHQGFSEDRKNLTELSPVPRPNSREVSIETSVWILNRLSLRRTPPLQKNIKNNFKTSVQIRNSSDSTQDYVEDCRQECSDYYSVTKYKNAVELSVINGCMKTAHFVLQLIFIVEATNISRS